MFSICHYRHLLFIFSPTDVFSRKQEESFRVQSVTKENKTSLEKTKKEDFLSSVSPLTGLSDSCSPLGYWSTSTAGHAVVRWQWQWAWELPGGNHSPVKLSERFNPLFFPAHDTRQRTLQWLSNSEREPPLLSISLVEKLENKVILSSLYGWNINILAGHLMRKKFYNQWKWKLDKQISDKYMMIKNIDIVFLN